jgi:small subunit ribosomal protein S16
MSVKLRLVRMGRRHRPFFRINVVDGRTPRNGKVLETIGHYDPIEKDKDKQVVLNSEKAKYWLDKGAIPTASAAQLLQRAGVKNKFAKEKVSKRSKARILVRKKGLPFTKAEKEVLQKKAEKEALQKKAEAEKKVEPPKPEQKT